MPSLKDAVKIAGVNGAVLHLASCCNPLPGDLIVGYVTRGRGLTVHRSDCQNVRNFEPERILSVSWEGQEEKPYPVKIRIVCLNEKGMLGKICDLIGEMDVNIDSGTFVSNVDGNSQLDFIVEVKDSTQLYAVLKKLKAVRILSALIDHFWTSCGNSNMPISANSYECNKQKTVKNAAIWQVTKHYRLIMRFRWTLTSTPAPFSVVKYM